ncbi:deoxyfructose oxidoreductase [Bryobacterales bacterium F-183]|nr:deoxyfructose oxidoreductase [Bryobacterales bacterium F-183]
MSRRKLRWGILGVSNFAVRKIIPAMRTCEYSELTGIASRDGARAKEAAATLGIPKSYGSYDELLADPEIDVVYNPLPNHLHVLWSIKAAEAGKHVLCEKPISTTTADLRSLIDAKNKHRVAVAEAFMIRFHPQWKRVSELVQSGAIGELRAVSTCFSYYNANPENVRNIVDYGGGGMWDIGCYAVNVSRLLFQTEPNAVAASFSPDPEFAVDRIASGILQFEKGQSVFVVGTQMVPYQRVQVFGTKGRIEVEIPFNALPGEGMRILIDNGTDLRGAGITSEVVEPCDQYTLQADAFSLAVQGEGTLVNSLEESFGNTAVLEAAFRSKESGRFEVPERL